MSASRLFAMVGVLGAFGALAAPSACSLADRAALPPEGQVVLYVTTDAVLPPPPSDPKGVPGLFDRLSIEIFPPGESTPCAGCARQFSVDSKSVDEGRTSMGYVPRPGVSGSRARVRLFRTLGADVVAQRATSTLETVIALPVVGGDGITEVTAVLDTASLGSPHGTLDAPVQPLSGKPAPGRVGTWEAARRRPCTDEAHAGEVCIAGGAFWLGQPAVALPFPDQKHGLERLVALSPYFLDASEVTVTAFRDSDIASDIGPGRNQIDAECNYAERPGLHENYPVNCISRDMAEEYCKKKGARLPTESEFEYAATAFGRYEFHPWGPDEPRCGDAIFGRSIGTGPMTTTTSRACAPATATAAVGTATRDRVLVTGAGGGVIVDLVGNVTEWMADDYGQESDPCWAPPILLDPRCVTTGATKLWSGRGGAYSSDPSFVSAKIRYSAPVKFDSRPRSLGFRCARSLE